jgi:hypothetical protein
LPQFSQRIRAGRRQVTYPRHKMFGENAERDARTKQQLKPSAAEHALLPALVTLCFLEDKHCQEEEIDSCAPAHFDLSVCPSMSRAARRLHS